jgi:hypothetical protein
MRLLDSYPVRFVVTFGQTMFFMVYLVLLIAIQGPIMLLFPKQFERLKAWDERRKLHKSRQHWFVTGAGHGSRYRYYDRGDWVLVFPVDDGGVGPDSNVGHFAWQMTNRPLTAEEIQLLDVRMRKWLHHETTKFLRFDPPGRHRASSETLAKFEAFEARRRR